MDKALRWGITFVGAFMGLTLAENFLPFLTWVFGEELAKIGLVKIISSIFLGIIAGAVIGFLIAPRLVRCMDRLIRWAVTKLLNIPLVDVITGAGGLVCGLIIANLFSLSFLSIPVFGQYIAMASNVVFGLIAMIFAIKKRQEILNLFSHRSKTVKECMKIMGESNVSVSKAKILDTSAIIDGRILDVCKTGFIEGTLLVSIYVLEELQHIADSGDALKRNRGRKGLDVLQSMQNDKNIQVVIDESKFESVAEVDSKLIRLAQKHNGKIITTDYNLNKVAELQKVQVLNVNELTNAVKSVILAGEEMMVNVLKEGKEQGQGVAYMDDGTMIVIERGSKYVGTNIAVQITSVLQTNAGKIIFAKPVK